MNTIDKLSKSKAAEARTTLNAVRELQAKLPPYAIKPTMGMVYGEQIKYPSWRFLADAFKSIEILHITDVQYGHIECQVDRFIEYRDWVLAKPNRFVVFGGDMIDAATVLSPGEPWENIYSPQRQVYRFCELAAPMRHRILGYVGGNHERRGIKTFGDLGVLIATLLQVPYSSGQQLIDIWYGDWKPYHIHLWHGTGGARTEGAKMQMICRFANNHPGSHLYLCGHLHDCLQRTSVRETRIPHRNQVKMTKFTTAMSSSFLNFWGTYAEVAGLAPTDTLMVRAVLEPNGKVEVTVR